MMQFPNQRDQAKIKTIVCGNTNAYLICGENGSILVDPGTKNYKEKVLNLCKSMNVKLIFLTHGHVDHCQNAAFLSKSLACPVGIGEGDIPLIQDGKIRKVYGNGPVKGFYAQASNWVIRHQRIELPNQK